MVGIHGEVELRVYVPKVKSFVFKMKGRLERLMPHMARGGYRTCWRAMLVTATDSYDVVYKEFTKKPVRLYIY